MHHRRQARREGSASREFAPPSHQPQPHTHPSTRRAMTPCSNEILIKLCDKRPRSRPGAVLCEQKGKDLSFFLFISQTRFVFVPRILILILLSRRTCSGWAASGCIDFCNCFNIKAKHTKTLFLHYPGGPNHGECRLFSLIFHDLNTF